MTGPDAAPAITQPKSSTQTLLLLLAVLSGVFLALSVHMVGQRFGLDIAGLWRDDMVRAPAALAWWVVASVAFVGGYVAARLLSQAAAGRASRGLTQFAAGVAILVFAAAGQAAAAPNPLPTLAGLLSGLAAIAIGTLMAFCGTHFALRRT